MGQYLETIYSNLIITLMNPFHDLAICHKTRFYAFELPVQLSLLKVPMFINNEPKLNLFILMFIFRMISIINCSLLNHGPGHVLSPSNVTGFSVYYQNVQGLIPFTELSNKYPKLDYTKIAEIHAYIHEERPDVIVLNETWLKSSDLDEEILPVNDYKIFRCDRSEFTHPCDPDNPCKFRRNGGGVLIAISSSLQVSSNAIDLKCKAEMLAVELILDDGSKIVLSTCYRVSTLGIQNCNVITSALSKLLRKKKLKKFLLIGDFNLSSTNWILNSSTNNTEQKFLEEFLRLGLVQCITSPTHNKDKILDILLTNSESHIGDIKITNNQEFCRSDHYGITFEVKFRIKRKKPIKIKSFNFKQVNWDRLNQELNSINWLLELDLQEPDIVWCRFKEILNYHLYVYIPFICVHTIYMCTYHLYVYIPFICVHTIYMCTYRK